MEIPSLNEVIPLAVGIAAAVALAWKKVSEYKMPDMKKEQGDMLAHIRGEKNDAIKQRDENAAINKELRDKNAALDRKVEALHLEVEAMKNKLVLLSELNTRLATTLDSTRGKLEEFLRTSPGAQPTGPQAPSFGAPPGPPPHAELQFHPQTDRGEE